MDRKNFFKHSLTGIIGLGIANSLLGKAIMNLATAPSPEFEPYTFRLDDPFFKDLLATHSLPDTIRIRARTTSDKVTWFDGEGKGDGKDYQIVGAVERYNLDRNPIYTLSTNAYTPVTILKAPTHDVYGQYFENHLGKVAIIRGFNSKYYFVHPAFRRVFTYEFECWGLPAADYVVETCSRCREKYIRQQFHKGCDQSIVTLTAFPDCSNGGNHDGLSLKKLAPCNLKDDDMPVAFDEY